jgi:SAM-dependent methyltransferase
MGVVSHANTERGGTSTARESCSLTDCLPGDRLARELHRLASRALFGARDKHTSPNFAAWREELLRSALTPERAANVPGRTFTDGQIGGHWVCKPMRRPYDALVVRARLAHTLDALRKRIPPDAAVLDVGAASGLVLLGLVGRRRCGVDRQHACVKRMRESGLEARVADAQELPFKTAEFDWVFLFECLEHIHSPLLAVQEAARVSGSGVAVSVPVFRRSRVHPARGGEFDGDRHVYELSPADWVRLFAHAGLRVSERHRIDLAEIACRSWLPRVTSLAVGQRWPRWDLFFLVKGHGAGTVA